MTLLYIIPFSEFNRKGLRSIPFLKTLIVAITWGVATVLPESLYADPKAISLFFARTTFILALTIPFDIRDIEHDQKDRLRTVVGQLGILKTKILVYTLFAISIVLHVQILGVDFVRTVLLIHLLPIVIVAHINQKSSEYWYTLGLDSTIIIQYFLLQEKI